MRNVDLLYLSIILGVVGLVVLGLWLLRPERPSKHQPDPQVERMASDAAFLFSIMKKHGKEGVSAYGNGTHLVAFIDEWNVVCKCGWKSENDFFAEDAAQEHLEMS